MNLKHSIGSATQGGTHVSLKLADFDRTHVAKPPLKWAGGKRWLVPYLRPLWEPFRECRLVEPMCGGLAVALGLNPNKALLNDINTHAVNFFRWLKRGLVITTIRMQNSSPLYYSHRSRFNELVRSDKSETKEAAELFYYLNRTCYNGLCRFNRAGEFNVPFGRYRRIHYTRDFTAYKKAFRKWKFTMGDFADVPLEQGDFVYADPPYDVEFTAYSREGFSWDDQVRLAQWLSKHPGPVVVSNQATPRMRRLYTAQGFQLRILDAPRLISCNGDRKPAKELLAVRNMPGNILALPGLSARLSRMMPRGSN